MPLAGSKRNGRGLEKRLRGIEVGIERLATLLARHSFGLTAPQPRLLRGLGQIGAYVQKSGRSVTRYRKLMGFPVIRWGRHVYSSPGLIDGWLAQVGKLKAEAALRRTETRPPDPPRARTEGS